MNWIANIRRKRWALLLISTTAVLASVMAVHHFWEPADAVAQAPVKQASKAAPSAVPANAPQGPVIPNVVAIVNGEQISKDELGKYCLRYHGKEVLESLVNRQLIVEACRKNNIVVTDQEVRTEIERLAKRFNLAVDQWLKMLKEERDINPQQYIHEIIWPTVALWKLAAKQIEPSEKEVIEAFENMYGAARQCRVIIVDTLPEAKRVHALATTTPDDFSKLAVEHSKDFNSASAGGLIQPIRRHMGDKNVEAAAFQLAEGQISGILPVNQQFGILKCERHIPARPVRIESVRELLVEQIKERNLTRQGQEIFRTLQQEARFEDVYNKPDLQQRFPGLAAVINDHRITLATLTEECIVRQGKKVLEGLIGRKLLEQACKKQNVVVNQNDMVKELSEMALGFDMKTPDGKPDIHAFMARMAKENEVTLEVYQDEYVWPTVALKKMVAATVKVTDEDLQKGFEANYGERVRCRAIVFNNQRRAREVWEQARRNTTLEQFGQLAELYSIDPSSRALKGEIPPIAKHGGRPLVEDEAFRLAPGELSSVIQVDDKWVVLLCEGRTKPVQVNYEEVKQYIYTEVFEKKQRMLMSNAYSELQEKAQIDNILAGTSQSGSEKLNASAAAVPAPNAQPAARPQGPSRR